MARIGNEDRIDRIAIAAITLLSALSYLPGLGFYGDDWDVLAFYTAHIGRSPFDFIGVGLTYPAIARPLQGLWYAALHAGFGLSPLPYHVANSLILALSAVLLLMLARSLGASRRFAFAVTLVFILLPQLSTVRVWFATFQITLSLMFFLIACLADLRWARGGGLRWKLGSLAAAAASLACYELFGPLLLAMAGLASRIRYVERREDGSRAKWRALWPQIPNVALVLAAVALKGRLSPRATALDLGFFRTIAARFVDPHHDWRTDNGINAKSTLIVQFWDTAALPFVSAARMLSLGTIAVPLILAAIIAAIGWWRLAARDHDVVAPPSLPRLLAIGGAIFALGHATFLLSGSVATSPAGIANRTASAAAIGVAIILLAPLTPLMRHRRRFAAAVAFLAALLSLRIADIGQHWTRAAIAQAAILIDARRDLASVQAGATVLIDGVCPYVGPAIVFEAPWDVAGALTLATGRKIRGDIITASTVWKPASVDATLYGVTTSYRHAPGLLVYNPARRWLVPLPDRAAADAYRARPGRFPHRCPRGNAGRGVPI